MLAMLYDFNKNYVLRDIGGIYFVVNIADKDIYRNKKIYSVNRTAFALLEIAKRKQLFSPEDLLDEFVSLLSGDIDRELIRKDLTDFCIDSLKKGMLTYGK